MEKSDVAKLSRVLDNLAIATAFLANAYDFA